MGDTCPAKLILRNVDARNESRADMKKGQNPKQKMTTTVPYTRTRASIHSHSKGLSTRLQQSSQQKKLKEAMQKPTQKANSKPIIQQD
jgi:hypothetical protein